MFKRTLVTDQQQILPSDSEMREGRHHLVKKLKIILVLFVLVVFLFIFVSYGVVGKVLQDTFETGEFILGQIAYTLKCSSCNASMQPPVSLTFGYGPVILPDISKTIEWINIKPGVNNDSLQAAPNWNFVESFGNLSLPVIGGAIQGNMSSVRILCVILTLEKDINTRAKAVNDTWVRRCDRHFFLLKSEQRRHDYLNIDITEDRKNIIHKMRRAYEIIYERYINDFDWLLKTDDDTYVILENLRRFVSVHDSNKPGHFGYLFKKFLQSGYMSGGAGYVISNAGFRQMLEKGLLINNCSIPKEPDDPESSEDVETGRCLEKVGVPVISSLDGENRETFHPYPPYKHLVGPLSGYIVTWGKNPVIVGEGCCSKYSISFHYLSPRSIYRMEQIIYNSKNRALMSKHDNQGIELPLDELKQVSY